ncbi:MAG: SNF2-related protein [Verrucomicrobiota bacterium]
MVAPTSVLLNWAAEAGRYAPRLRVLPLRVPDRKEHFDQIPESDLVLTNYALLSRDRDVLVAQEFHYVVLDEALTSKTRNVAGCL